MDIICDDKERYMLYIVEVMLKSLLKMNCFLHVLELSFNNKQPKIKKSFYTLLKMVFEAFLVDVH
jgi:hypothetical protein